MRNKYTQKTSRAYAQGVFIFGNLILWGVILPLISYTK